MMTQTFFDDGLSPESAYCSECEAPLDSADAHVCKACIAEDAFNEELNRFASDVDAYIDWRFEPCDY